MAANDAQIVRDTLARLDGGERWLKGRGSDDEGNLCLLTALYESSGFWPDRILKALGSVIGAEFPDRGGSGIPIFNDHPDTTFADIEMVCSKAAVNLEAMV